MLDDEQERALIACARRHMSPRALDATDWLPEVFELKAAEELKEAGPAMERLRAERDQAAALYYALDVVREFASAFARQRRAWDLAALSLAAYGGTAPCALCGRASPVDALPCCGSGVHRSCWVAQRLRGKPGCRQCT